MCRLQNQNVKEQLLKFSYGVVRVVHSFFETFSRRVTQYYYIHFDEEVKATEYWKKLYFNPIWDVINVYDINYLWNNFTVCLITYDDLDLCKEDVTDKLLYDSPDDSLHLEVYDDEPDCQIPLLSGGTAEQPSTWSGFHLLKQVDGTFAGKTSAGIVHLHLPPLGVGSGPVTGTGTDYTGDFSIEGTLDGSTMVYNKCYTSQEGYRVRYQGTLSAERDALEGVWGNPSKANDKSGDDLVTPLDDADITGRFVYSIAPSRFSFIKVDEEERAANKPRALWKFAIQTVRNLVRIKAGLFSWEYLEERRKIRKRFLALFSRLEDPSSSWPYASSLPALTPEESEELAALVAMLPKDDLQFYKRLSAALQRRRTIHW